MPIKISASSFCGAGYRNAFNFRADFNCVILGQRFAKFKPAKINPRKGNLKVPFSFRKTNVG